MSHDTIIHHIVRPAVRRVAPSGITPNLVTTLRLATGLAAAACFAGGWLAVGAGVFLLSLLLDRADGELARQTGQMSASGHRYDLAADCLASMAAFVGLGIGLAAGHGAAAIWGGTAAGLGIGLLFAELNLFALVAVRGQRLTEGVSVDPDDAMVLVPVLIWCGLAWPMTIAAAVVTPIGAAAVAAIGLMRRR
jgi:phosphatidylglycerophosphate synthase